MTADSLSNARLVSCSCPLCAGDDPEPHLTANDSTFGMPGEFHVVRCRSCGMLYTHPRVDPADIPSFYPPDYSAHAALRSKTHHRPGRDIWDRLPLIGGRRLLDIGCGSGAFIARCKSAGWTVAGLEPNARAADSARRLGLDVIHGSLPTDCLDGRRFEVVTLLGVLDHVSDPLLTLRAVRGLMEPSGLLIITVPNAASAAARIFGPLWPGWDLPRHVNHFTPDTLSTMLSKVGFSRIEFQWKRRPARWRRGVRLMHETTGLFRWKLLSASRDLCGLFCRLRSRGARSDEIVAIARNPS